MQHCARRCAQCEAEKDRASQKQRSDFLAAPFHKAPPGRQKSERKFCLFGGVLFVRRAAPSAGAAVFAKPAAIWPVGFCARCFGVSSLLQPWRLCVRFAAGGPAFCGFVPGLRASLSAAFVAAFVPGLRCCLLLLSFACVAGVCLPSARLFALVFSLFLPNFFLSKFFSFVAQAATGLYFLPKRK